ncbi:group II intron reverse transcriptase/maturase [Paraburkholderia sp. PGU19]|uniref:group II intron reverse transcriptase/maturase n=1 Tax=Paraburkholderia sp. PGU19 TaxID=2735434 RepID=UPI0015DC19E5|nr:group II intron reverse transcriptase/maturase [Paraburkholderia sp. PGU19]BCF95670.1 group II intron reverse transcriptase/maturase [Paraburkholderia sp. PGU19]
MAADPEPESPSACDRLMEEVCERENLQQALKRVKANKGAPGVDGMTVQALPAYLREHWPSIKDALLNGTYKPQPVRRVEIPKPDGGGVRKLGIPSALNRLVQQAVLQVLQRQWDPTFSDSSYGFRPGRSAHQAVARAQGYIQAGHGWVVDLDLAQFFDRVNHDILMSRVASRISDKRMLKLIRAFLTAGVMEHGLVGATDEGTPQGGPLSPLLSNLMLDDLDKLLEQRGLRFVRYADDCNVYVRSERAGQRVMMGLKAFLTGKLKLTVNEAKSAVAPPHTRKFLGFTFSSREQVKRRIAPKALTRFKERIRELTQRTRGISVDQMIGTLKRYLTGWRGYFGFCETPSVLKRLDEWIRRRIRCFFWKQWKRGRTRFKELTARGVSRDLAARTVGSPHNAWRLSCSPALGLALPNRYLRSLGLPSVGPAG